MKIIVPTLKVFIWSKLINMCEVLRTVHIRSTIGLLAFVTAWSLNKLERSLMHCLICSSGKSFHEEHVDF